MKRVRFAAFAALIGAGCADQVRVEGGPDTPADSGSGDAQTAPAIDAPSACGTESDDHDGDGFSELDGDCNDCDAVQNPGAFDVVGSDVDEDCNGAVDDDGASCDGPIAIDTTDPKDLARAVGLCRFVESGSKAWGVLGAEITQADAKSPTDPLFHGVLRRFGTNNAAREGEQLLALSSGTARSRLDPDAVNPNDVGYHRHDLEVPFPPGHPKSAQGCPGPETPTANDSVALSLQIRVPTNANALSFELAFFTPEHPEFACSPYNDAFVALLESGAPTDPGQDGNIAFDALGSPISVNAGFFSITSGPLLAETFLDKGFGGTTGWLKTIAPVIPGEIITLRFVIWDASDHGYDSTILLDAFRWQAEAAIAPVTEPVK